jgi:hypothetical protein
VRPQRILRGRAATVFLAAAVALLLCGAVAPAGLSTAGATSPAISPVVIDFYFQPGCHECARVREEILPELTMRYEGFYELNERDIGVGDNYLKLAAVQRNLENEKNAPVAMVLDERFLLSGFEEIAEGLFPRLDELVAERAAGSGPAPPAGEAGPAAVPAEGDQEGTILHERARGFTLPGVVVAGLVDGINPCATSTLVFFISLLAVLKVSGRRLVVVGSCFVAASFLTYLAIGFGLLRFLHLFSGYASLRSGINTVMVGLLAVFATLSFLDAWRYHRSGDAADVTLQLPKRVKLWIHRIMRGGLATHNLVVGSLVSGAAVTVLESACTGQVYLPTLVMLVKSGGADLRSYLYLLLYNLMFQVPIVVVFVLTLQGLKTAELMSLSRKSVVGSKIAMGLFFVGMAVLILLL